MTGWRRFPAEDAVLDWVRAVRPVAGAVLADPAEDHWYRHGRTWFAGVDALPNDAAGRVPVRGAGPSRSPEYFESKEGAWGPPLSGAALAAASDVAGPLPLHRGQLSVTWPAYPGRDPDESESSYRYRRDRAAAHLDGLLPVGSARRRMAREPHAWILGLPLDEMGPGRSPLVVWEGSHEVIRTALRSAYDGRDPADWPDIDVTDIYQDARRTVFETCDRVEVTAQAGEAVLLHRLLIHGVAPWTGPEGPPRAVVYFRPVLPGGVADWLALP
ncbi:hypothetical protein HKCCE3408_06030 [Rhodobacterales bacterium HKCCE3408]|nr:hypothetical protein [Rhodobacterales bacterium HKCCE3408]